jgi:hypothetical protein
MFGPVKIRRWILLVPVADSRQTTVHATKQTERILAANLPYADDAIFVLVRTLAAYQESLDAVINARLARLSLPPVSSAPDYTLLSTQLVDTMHSKLTKVPKLAREEKRREYVQRLLTEHLNGRTYRDFIRDHYSELDSELDHLFGDLENRLHTKFSLADDPPETMLLRVMDDAEERVRRVFQQIGDNDARIIAEGQVADWLMRCPLDFDDSGASAA